MEDRIVFSAGAHELEGRLFVPASAADVGVVVCHPHPLRGGDMENSVVSALVAGFREAGYATLRFNFRGVGSSGGAHDDGRGEQDDVMAAVTCLLRQPVATVIVAGYSFGALVGMQAGGADERVHKLIGVGLPIGIRDASFLASVAKPKLLVVGDSDAYAPLAVVTRLMATLISPKCLVVVDGADHFFQGVEDQVAVAAVAFCGAEQL